MRISISLITIKDYKKELLLGSLIKIVPTFAYGIAFKYFNVCSTAKALIRIMIATIKLAPKSMEIS